MSQAPPSDPLRVLYVHHAGAFGGSSRSLFEAVRGLGPAVHPSFLTQRGTAAAFFRQLGEVEEIRGLTQVDNSRYTHYRGLRWVVVLRELGYLPSTLLGLLRARRRWGRFDLIHVNEVTALVPALLARWIFRAPVVVHVRTLARVQEGSIRTAWGNRVLARDVARVIAIDETVRATLPLALPVEVIHNAFTPSPARDPDLAFEERLAALRPSSFKVGFVGNLLRVKGIQDLVEAARILRDRRVDVEFLVVGDDIRPRRGWKAALLRRMGLGQDMRAEVEAMLDAYALRDHVHLLGFSSDIVRAYRRMDVLTFPSHMDAPGRPVFEAAFLGVPSIVAIRDPRPDTLIPDRTGLAIRAGSPAELADAIESLARDPGRARALGEAARELATRTFDVEGNARRLLDVYREVVAPHRP
jgi:glycosyltransferase involved in cell wall biosynthesis